MALQETETVKQAQHGETALLVSGEQLDVLAIAKGYQGVVAELTGVHTPGGDREAHRRKLLRCANQVGDDQDGVIEDKGSLGFSLAWLVHSWRRVYR